MTNITKGPDVRHIDDIPVYEPPGHKDTYNRRLFDGPETAPCAMSLGTMGEGGCSDSHAHLKSHQAMFIISGEAVVEMDGEKHHCGPGSVVRIPPGVEHRISAGGRGLKFIILFSPPPTDAEK